MKKFLSLIFAFFLCLNLYGCQKTESQSLEFVTSCYPIYVMTMNLVDGIDGVRIKNMAENHQGCLHDFQLQSDDLKNIEKCSAFIINGAGMELFMDKIINELPRINVIDSSEDIELICEEHSHEHEEHEEKCEHCCVEYNPHIWLSVSNYITQVQNIADGLCEIDPTHKEAYQQNAKTYIAKLATLKDEIKAQISGIKSKDVITFHEAFPYFAQEFGLNIAAVINEEPESDPNPKQLAETIEIAKNLNIKALFTEPQYPSTSAQIIAKEIGAKIYTLDPAVTGENSKDAYINTMKKNAETLKLALN